MSYYYLPMSLQVTILDEPRSPDEEDRDTSPIRSRIARRLSGAANRISRHFVDSDSESISSDSISDCIGAGTAAFLASFNFLFSS